LYAALFGKVPSYAMIEGSQKADEEMEDESESNRHVTTSTRVLRSVTKAKKPSAATTASAKKKKGKRASFSSPEKKKALDVDRMMQDFLPPGTITLSKYIYYDLIFSSCSESCDTRSLKRMRMDRSTTINLDTGR
jgi:hypothetical protein